VPAPVDSIFCLVTVRGSDEAAGRGSLSSFLPQHHRNRGMPANTTEINLL
jgi:hypothetical protein